MGERVSYVDACQAGREALQRARRARELRPFDRDVLGVLLELVPFYSRLSDEVGTRQIAALLYGIDASSVTGFQRDRVGASLRALDAAGVVVVESTRGRYPRTTVTFPLSQSSAETPDCSPAQASASALDDGSQSSADRGSIQRGSRLNPARRVGHSEKNSEKTSERVRARDPIAAARDHARTLARVVGIDEEHAQHELVARYGSHAGERGLDEFRRLRAVTPGTEPPDEVAAAKAAGLLEHALAATRVT